VKSGASGYRLPTEAEWEAAARGGNPSATAWSYTYAGSNTIDDVAWYYSGNTGHEHEVGTKNQNSAGIYDMTGSWGEWCFDWFSDSVGTGTAADPIGATSGSQRVVRGGSLYDPAEFCVVALRSCAAPNYYWGGGLGFRVVCAP